MVEIGTASVIRLADVKKDIFEKNGWGKKHYCAPRIETTPAPVAVPAAAREEIELPVSRGAVRAMMVMAVECAFDLRLGRKSSPYLDRFDARYAILRNLLNETRSNPASGDLRLVVRRAEEALAEFFETVQSKVVVGVKPWMEPDSPEFNDILATVNGAAIKAGGAAGLLEMAYANR